MRAFVESLAKTTLVAVALYFLARAAARWLETTLNVGPGLGEGRAIGRVRTHLQGRLLPLALLSALAYAVAGQLGYHPSPLVILLWWLALLGLELGAPTRRGGDRAQHGGSPAGRVAGPVHRTWNTVIGRGERPVRLPHRTGGLYQCGARTPGGTACRRTVAAPGQRCPQHQRPA